MLSVVQVSKYGAYTCRGQIRGPLAAWAAGWASTDAARSATAIRASTPRRIIRNPLTEPGTEKKLSLRKHPSGRLVKTVRSDAPQTVPCHIAWTISRLPGHRNDKTPDHGGIAEVLRDLCDP